MIQRITAYGICAFLAMSCKSTNADKVCDLDMREIITFHKKVGEEVAMKVTSNPTTGYDWYTNYDEKNNSISVHSYFETNNSEELLGAPSLKHYKIKALKTGTFIIKMEYKRPFEPNEKPLKTKTITLIAQ